jgi:hypothetical protein
MPAISPFYFAWVDVGDTTFGPEHFVIDEEIISFKLEHNEGDFASLIIDVRNPRIGPLAPGRPVWAWFSWENDTDVIPLFFGRLVGVPTNILSEVITYTLIARPVNYPELKEALAASLRVLPFYDPLFVDAAHQDDPDVVLEGYTKVYHVDRVTHDVSVSDVLVGEDGVVVFDQSTVPYDSVDITMEAMPLSKVTVKGSVPWSQTFPQQEIKVGPFKFTTADGAGAASNWPKQGDTVAGGYVVLSSNATGSTPMGRLDYKYSYTNREDKHDDGDLLTYNESFSTPIGTQPLLFGKVVSDDLQYQPPDKATGTGMSRQESVQRVGILFGEFRGEATLGISQTQDRADNIAITVESDLQPVLRDPEEPGDSEIIELNANDAAAEDCSASPITSPIELPLRSQYAPTDRGLQSIQYMIARARSRLVVSSRAIKISFSCAFHAAVDLSCRKNAVLSDGRIPGETAIGKVVRYSLEGNGNTGAFFGSVDMACAIGLGNAITTSPGTADYVDPDYVDDYQTFTGQVVALPSNDIGFSPPFITMGGGGGFFPGNAQDLLERAEIKGSPADQRKAIEDSLDKRIDITIGGQARGVAHYEYYNEHAQRMAEAAAEAQVWVELELRDLTSNDAIDTGWSVTTTRLVIPKQIDLMSGSTA